MRISFSASTSTGEADITRKSRAEIEEMIEQNPLLAADIMKDIMCDARLLYNDARVALGWEPIQWPD